MAYGMYPTAADRPPGVPRVIATIWAIATGSPQAPGGVTISDCLVGLAPGDNDTQVKLPVGCGPADENDVPELVEQTVKDWLTDAFFHTDAQDALISIRHHLGSEVTELYTMMLCDAYHSRGLVTPERIEALASQEFEEACGGEHELSPEEVSSLVDAIREAM